MTRDVENDWVIARLGVTAEDADPARLADRINQEMTWALGLARGREAVEARSGGYTTLPISEPKTGRLRREKSRGHQYEIRTDHSSLQTDGVLRGFGLLLSW